VLALAGLSGCKEEPIEAYEAARLAAEAKDEAAFYECFTERSGELLRRLDRLDSETSGRLSFHRSPFDVHKFGVVADSEVHGDEAILTVDVAGRSERVHLAFEGGRWRIDAFELPGFWEPLRH
jgi:hypothetical protein